MTSSVLVAPCFSRVCSCQTRTLLQWVLVCLEINAGSTIGLSSFLSVQSPSIHPMSEQLTISSLHNSALCRTSPPTIAYVHLAMSTSLRAGTNVTFTDRNLLCGLILTALTYMESHSYLVRAPFSVCPVPTAKQ